MRFYTVYFGLFHTLAYEPDFALGSFSDVIDDIFLLTLTILSFRTKFTEHVFTTKLASYALILHI